MDVCCAFYHRVNDDIFETFLKTFRKVNQEALLQVYTDNVPKDYQKKWSGEYEVLWRQLKPEQVKDKRCLTRIKCLQKCIEEHAEGDRIILCDVDLYFLEDPFSAFDKVDFNVGVTLRLHRYQFPVNSGIVFVNVNDSSRYCFKDVLGEYIEENEKYYDWLIDQNFVNKLYKDGLAKDVGWEYNFCPNTDVFGLKLAANMIKRAYGSKSVKVLHLKSELKLCVYAGFLEDAIHNNRDGVWNWQKEGK